VCRGGRLDETTLRFFGQQAQENRNAILADLQTEPADKYAQRCAAPAMTDEVLPVADLPANPTSMRSPDFLSIPFAPHSQSGSRASA
jgi:hypothetical protein